MGMYVYEFHCDALWHRVIPRAAPWVTAQYPPDGKVQAFQRAVLAQCLNGVLRTGGGKTARWRCQWRYCPLVEPDGQNKYCCQQFSHSIPCFASMLSSNLPIFFLMNAVLLCLLSMYMMATAIFLPFFCNASMKGCLLVR